MCKSTGYYKTFWSSVGELMTDTYNCSFDSGEMSGSQKQAITTLTNKKGRDRMYLEIWRSISLVYADSMFADQYQYLGNCPPTPPLTQH